MPSISSSTAGSNDIYVYGAGILAVLAISVFVVNKTSQAANKKQVYEKQPPKRRLFDCSFDWKKNVEDSINDGLIITAAATGTFFALKAAGVKLPKASLDTIDITKLTDGICGWVLVQNYAVYEKWINEWCNKNFVAP